MPRRTRADKVREKQTDSIQPFVPKTNNQKRFLESIYNKPITIAHGSAGTGKTIVAANAAIKFLKNKWVSKIYYLRSDVGDMHYRGRGALPGEAHEKFKPLLMPLFCNLQQLIPQGEIDYLLEKQIIEGILTEDIRGLSLNHAFLIADECQNMHPDTIKTILTRIGEDSTFVLIGDTKQRDATFSDGLSDAATRLTGLDDVGIIQFKPEDIVRHPLIRTILERYGD